MFFGFVLAPPKPNLGYALGGDLRLCVLSLLRRRLGKPRRAVAIVLLSLLFVFTRNLIRTNIIRFYNVPVFNTLTIRDLDHLRALQERQGVRLYVSSALEREKVFRANPSIRTEVSFRYFGLGYGHCGIGRVVQQTNWGFMVKQTGQKSSRTVLLASQDSAEVIRKQHCNTRITTLSILGHFYFHRLASETSRNIC